MRFVIWAPTWQHNSAGIMVLHRLCERLLCAGYNACVTSPGNPEWNEPIFDGTFQEDDFVIYPEIIRGNPMGAKRVIRYMLWYPWHHFGNDRIPKHELVIPYAKFVIPHTQAICDYEITDDHVLEISISDPDIFYRHSCEGKKLTAFWVSKCDQETVKRFPMPKDAIQITHYQTRQEYIDLLYKTKTFYSFDMNTGVSVEASLCGAECFLITADNRVVPWRGATNEENRFNYSSIDYIHRFVKLASEFNYD